MLWRWVNPVKHFGAVVAVKADGSPVATRKRLHAPSSETIVHSRLWADQVLRRALCGEFPLQCHWVTSQADFTTFTSLPDKQP